jgi:UDP-N-acetylglucosamine/UDP-N-acetylgalactosamine diphosphorylase
MISPGQVRVADPTFLGYFIDKGVATAAKVVRKVK